MDSDDSTWFRFESQISLTTQGKYGGICQVYRVGIGEVLPEIKRAQVINFDLGIGDPVTPKPQKAETPSYFPQNEDISRSVYSIETICAERLHAMIVHGDANSLQRCLRSFPVFA